MAEFPEKYYKMDEPVRRFANRNLIGIKKDETVQKAAQRMDEFDMSSLVVLNDSEEIVGFFTDSDIKSKVTAKGLKPDIPVKEIMETDLITIEIDTPVKRATKKMTEQGVKHLLVEEEDEIKGILTFSDLIGVEELEINTHISR